MIQSWRPSRLVLFLLIARLIPPSHALWDEMDYGYYERPLHVTAQQKKRDATLCPTSYILCPASLNGGCCPTDRACGTASCLPASAPPTECSKSGYFACGIDQGG